MTNPTTPPVIVLDGGLSNALGERGHDLTDELWTARLLRDAPGEVAAVHRAYFDAGAQVATTASYQASVPGFEHSGMTRTEAENLITRSVAIAREVRDDVAESAGDDVVRLVAASVGPYGAVLADGSEYRGRYGLSRAALRDFHAPRMELLASAGPDMLAFETIPDLDEVAVLLDLAEEFAIPAWLSCTVSGDRLRDGRPAVEAFALAARHHSTRYRVGRTAVSQLEHASSGSFAASDPRTDLRWRAPPRGWRGVRTVEVTVRPCRSLSRSSLRTWATASDGHPRAKPGAGCASVCRAGAWPNWSSPSTGIPSASSRNSTRPD